MQYSNKINIWVECLGVVDLFCLMLQTLFTGCIIRYDEHQVSIFCKKLIKLMQKLKLSNNFIPANLSFDKKDSKGNAFYYSKYEDIRTCLDRFCNQYISNEANAIKETAKTYITFYILPQISFIRMVETQVSQYQNNMIYLKRRPFSFIINEFYKEKFVIKNSLNVIEIMKYFMRPYYFLLFILLSKIATYKIKTNICKIKPSIWVEYAYKDVVNFIFWRDSVNPEDYEIICYLDRIDTPPSIEIINDINNNGVKWVDAHLYSMAKLTNFNLKIVKELLGKLFSKKFKYPHCYRIFMFEYDFWFLFYRSIFEYFKTKILIQHQDWSWKQGVQAAAIESAGGIMVGFHWSNYQNNVTPHLLFPFHVFFVWGKLIYDLIKKDNTCKYIIPSGCWMVRDNNKITQISSVLNKSLFIISIFDATVIYNIYQTPETLSQFYLTVLSLLEDNPSWGGIIKSKNWNLDGLLFLPNGNEIVGKIKMLIKKKQIIFLDTNFSPATASAYANLSVCYGLNSAGIIAGIHGNRAVHWDCSGWLKHPFYKDKDQKFIYSTLDEVEQAIIKASKGDNTIGDFSKWRQRLNYFDDFKAPERVGRFIQTFMDEVIKTDNAEHSLDFAVKRYIEENKIGEDIFKPEDWWD